MSTPIRYAARRWWWRKFHPAVRIGWVTTTAGSDHVPTRTVVGLGLIAAGLILGGPRKKTLLYRGRIDPGTETRIRVLRGSSVVHDAPLEV